MSTKLSQPLLCNESSTLGALHAEQTIVNPLRTFARLVSSNKPDGCAHDEFGKLSSALPEGRTNFGFKSLAFNQSPFKPSGNRESLRAIRAPH